MRGLLVALLFCAGVCSWNAGWALDEATRAGLVAAGKASPVRKLETWASWLARPTEARIGPASAALLEYLAIDNRLLGYPGIPRASTDPGLRRLLRTALTELPSEVLRLVDDRLAAVVIVRDLGSSGFTDIIRDTAGNPVAAFIVLDETLFTRKANAWATWRDSTVFRSSPHYRIETRIAREGEDSRLAAVQYLLVHELAHVYAIGRDIHPPWGESLARYDLRDFPFADLSWEIDAARAGYRSRHAAVFALRGHIRFYRAPVLLAADIPRVVSQLQQTSYVNLYAAISPEEDFAEAFAMYVHLELLGRPYVTEAIVDDRVEVRFTPCFPERCRQKYRFLQTLFQP